MSYQLIASLLAGAAIAISCYIFFRKYIIAIITAISVIAIPLYYFSGFIYPLSHYSFIQVIQIVIIALIALAGGSTYWRTLKWCDNQTNHFKIVIFLLACTALNFQFIGFEKPTPKPSFIKEMIAYFKPVKGATK